jgi:hypothetical protein
MKTSVLFPVALGLISCAGGDAADKPVDVEGPALYVIATAVSSAETSTTYVKTLPSLGPQTLTLDGAREFSGFSDLRVIGGRVFVSIGDSPTVVRFAVNAQGALEEEGRISFLNHGGSGAFYQQAVISPTKAYLWTETEYVVWNPSTLEITGTIPLPITGKRQGIDSFWAYDRGAVVRGNRFFHSVSWLDYKTYQMLDQSEIAVIDTDTDKLVKVLSSPCPNLDGATVDDGGNIYFSNWIYSPGSTLTGKGGKACVTRIAAGSEELDPSWSMKLADLTGGHEAAALRMLGPGRALVSVFHEGNQPFDPSKDDVSTWLFGNNWKFWTVDLTARAAQEVSGVGWHAGGYYSERIDGRTYLLVPGDQYASTNIYVLGADGQAHPIISNAPGWSTRLYKVR